MADKLLGEGQKWILWMLKRKTTFLENMKLTLNAFQNVTSKHRVQAIHTVKAGKFLGLTMCACPQPLLAFLEVPTFLSFSSFGEGIQNENSFFFVCSLV